MDKYIDAEWLKQNFNTVFWSQITKTIDSAPSIDIVRCKECKYAHMTYDGDCKYCDMWKDDDDSCIELYLDGDFYCADGERKESE